MISKRELFLPAFLFFIFIPIFSYIDINTSLLFFKDGKFSPHPLFFFFYTYGLIPGWTVGYIALTLIPISLFLGMFRKIGIYALYLVLTLAVGSGLFINGVFKKYWGRPRPQQIETFGGSETFQAVFKPHFFSEKKHRSFPCGHASFGFYFFSFYFLGKRLHKKWLSYFGITTGLLLGLFLSLSRIAQGGHFLSDTLMSALIMWYTALFLNIIIYKKTQNYP